MPAAPQPALSTAADAPAIPSRRPAATSLTVALDTAQADRFRTWSRAEGGVSAVLRRLVSEALGEGPSPPRPGPGTGRQVGVRLRERERAALAAAAAERGMTPAGWLRALACARLLAHPCWNGAELDTLRDAAFTLRGIRGALREVAERLEAAARMHPSRRAERASATAQAAQEAAGLARDAAGQTGAQVERLEGLVTGNLAYWGVPAGERPRPPCPVPERVEPQEGTGLPPLGEAGRAALAEVMRRYDEKERTRRAEVEAHVRAVLSERERAGAPLLPEAEPRPVRP